MKWIILPSMWQLSDRGMVLVWSQQSFSFIQQEMSQANIWSFENQPSGPLIVCSSNNPYTFHSLILWCILHRLHVQVKSKLLDRYFLIPSPLTNFFLWITAPHTDKVLSLLNVVVLHGKHYWASRMWFKNSCWLILWNFRTKMCANNMLMLYY